MYSNQGYGSASPPPINNPFIESSPQNRFPDISETPSQLSPSGLSPQYSSWPSSLSPTGYSIQQQQQPLFQQPGGPSVPMSPQRPYQFSPSSSFGQQLVYGINAGSPYGYPQNNGYQGTPFGNASGYAVTPTPQQQIQNNTGYIAQFDPYASIGKGWDGQNQSQGQPRTPRSPSSNGNLHPRDHIRAHKAELEIWDPYAWKQLLNSFDALKSTWEAWKRELEGRVGQLQTQMQYGGGGYHPAQLQQEGSRLQMLMKEAESHIDSVAASSFQLREVFEGYRQSADAASKRRVRESCNAALHSLPDWPQPY